MSTRLALTVVGTVVGAYFGYPQLGAMAGALIGQAVDPTTIQGPTINEGAAQTVAEGVPRIKIFGRWQCGGNIIMRGELRIVDTSHREGGSMGTKVKGQKAYRTYAIGICKGGENLVLLRVIKDNKLVADFTAGSTMASESLQWMNNKRFYKGSETQLPDPALEAINADTPAFVGSAYMVFIDDDLTDMNGAISQYQFEMATSADSAIDPVEVGPDNPGYITDIAIDDNGNVLMLRDQTGGSPEFGVGTTGTFTIATYSKDNINTLLSSNVIPNGGDALYPPGDQRIGPIAISPQGFVFSGEQLGSNANNRLMGGGTTVAHLLNWNGDWNWGSEFSLGTPECYGGLIFYDATHIYIGWTRASFTALTCWPLSSGSINPSGYVSNPITATESMAMHMDRGGTVRVISRSSWTTFREYSPLVLTHIQDIPVYGSPVAQAGGASKLYGFGVDDALGLAAYVYNGAGLSMRVAVFNFAGMLITDQQLTDTLDSNHHNSQALKVLFTDQNIFISLRNKIFRLRIAVTYDPNTVPLSSIVDWVHQYCNFPAGEWDSSQLSEPIRGFGLASAGYTGADAIDALRLKANFDKSQRGEMMVYQKRGMAAVKTLTVSDLTTRSDSTQREQAQEIPYKLNVRYPNPDSGFATLKETTGSVSPDRRTVGEVTLDVPVAMSSDEAAQAADIAYKTMLAEKDGTVILSVMLDVATDLAEADVIGWDSTYSAPLRLRIEQTDFENWMLKLTCKVDRQSAYTSNVTGLPAPAPIVPPSSIPGDTVMVVVDGPARMDSEDRLGLIVGVTGASLAWSGAELQRSLDGGANYSPAAQFEFASVMGILLADVPAAAPHLTDTTNEVRIQLYRSTQTLESQSEMAFNSYQGVFALENADGTFEWMQALDVVDDGNDQYTLTTLHRGVANTGGHAHLMGAKFLMISGATFVDVSSGLLGTDLTHRAVSYGQSEDDVSNAETAEFVGNSQREWAPTMLTLARDGSDILTCSVIPVHRFGNDINPVASINFQGFRWTFDDGSTTATQDTTSPSTTFDASAMSAPVTVTVGEINRFTGVGDTTSGSV